MTKRLAAVAALSVLGLSACTPSHTALHSVSKSASSSTSSVTTGAGGLDSKIRVVHTPKILVKDISTSLRNCQFVVKGATAGYYLPDRNCSPGAVDPAVTQSNIDTTICTNGYTKKVRPGTSVTSPVKKEEYKMYNVDPVEHPYRTTELDHVISEVLGGATTTSNLYPEPNKEGAKGTTNPKDSVELALRSLVCNKTVPLVSAQNAIARDWTTAVSSLGYHPKVRNKKSLLCSDAGICVPARWADKSDDES